VASWGTFVFRHRWWVLLGSLLAFAASGLLLSRGGTLQNSNSFHFEASRGFALESEQLPSSSASGFQLVLDSSTLRVGDPAFAAAVETALGRLRRNPRVATIVLPPLGDPAAQSPLISTDRHAVIAEVGLNIPDFTTATKDYPSLRDEVQSSSLTVHAAGDLALNSDFNTRSEQDLQRADVSIPAALVLLVLVFGSVAAALLCLGVGVVSVAGGLAAMYQLAAHTTVSTYALNVVAILGLGVAIDYSLFVVSRFREELRRQENVEAALAATLATAGKAIAFSGITVAVGSTGLLFYTGTVLTSMGLAATFVVLISVAYSLTFLPALLAVLGDRVNRLRPASLLPAGRRRLAAPLASPAPEARGFWARLAGFVMRRPIAVLIPCLALLFVAGSPFFQIQLAQASVNLLPPSDDARQGSELLSSRFGQGTAIDVILEFPGSPFTAASISTAYSTAQRLQATSGISHVTGYVALPGLNDLPAYQQLYRGGLSALPDSLRTQVTALTGTSIAVLRAYTPYAETSGAAQAVVRDIRAHDRVAGASVVVTGNTAFDIDYVAYMLGRTPWAALYVMAVTFAILVILLRSLVLPLKAVVMNLLSLSAAFGALVFIFQQGHLSGLLDFSPAPLDPTIPVLLFAVVFGLSMDYEVFLLTRMREAWLASGDNRRAVALGLQASGGIVTGAAAIMITVFLVFGVVSSVVVVKSIGLGMAIAVFVDATIVRALVVPALMRLIGPANWWAPRWLRQRARARTEDAAA
jgi:RND superfamily putative drug exporter